MTSHSQYKCINTSKHAHRRLVVWMCNVTSLVGKGPELVQKVTLYQLDIVQSGQTSEWSEENVLQQMKRGNECSQKVFGASTLQGDFAIEGRLPWAAARRIPPWSSHQLVVLTDDSSETGWWNDEACEDWVVMENGSMNELEAIVSKKTVARWKANSEGASLSYWIDVPSWCEPMMLVDSPR